jgi:23S rRNA (guanosine2251-2'-O)-methyltransferase
MDHFELRECVNSGCALRFPMLVGERLPGGRCPQCNAAMRIVHTWSTTVETNGGIRQRQLLPLCALVDNVRSTFNVGSIFRSADGVGLQQLYLCGISPTPAHPKLRKTALGAESNVQWSYHTNALHLARDLKANGQQLWALEEHPRATSLFNVEFTVLPSQCAPITLIMGNERAGVDPDLLALCEQIICIPMHGNKQSLNVATAFGIAVYLLAQRLRADKVTR